MNGLLDRNGKKFAKRGKTGVNMVVKEAKKQVEKATEEAKDVGEAAVTTGKHMLQPKKWKSAWNEVKGDLPINAIGVVAALFVVGTISAAVTKGSYTKKVANIIR